MIFVCIALVWLTGFSIARFLFPAPAGWSLHGVFLFSLGTGLGIGIASCVYFVSLLLFGPSPLISGRIRGDRGCRRDFARPERQVSRYRA